MTTRIYNSQYFDWTPETSPVRKSGLLFQIEVCYAVLKRREGSIPTQEDRLATLERKVAAMELQRLYDERKAVERTPSETSLQLYRD